MQTVGCLVLSAFLLEFVLTSACYSMGLGFISLLLLPGPGSAAADGKTPADRCDTARFSVSEQWGSALAC